MKPGYATLSPRSMIGIPSLARASTSSRLPTAATIPSSISRASASGGSSIVRIRPTITMSALAGIAEPVALGAAVTVADTVPLGPGEPVAEAGGGEPGLLLAGGPAVQPVITPANATMHQNAGTSWERRTPTGST